jgi:hypothetical protein
MSTLTVTAPASTMIVDRAISAALYAVWLPLAIGMIPISATKKELRHRVRFGFVLPLLLLLGACSVGSSSVDSEAVTQPKPQNYTVTVTGTSGAIQHTTQVMVTVN